VIASLARCGALSVVLVGTTWAGDHAGAQVPEGVRVVGLGGSGAGVGYAGLVGADGGVHVGTVRGRVALEDVHVLVELPFATYRAGEVRDADLGHLALSGFYALPYGDLDHAVGLRAHFGVGEGTWVWLNRPDELWPGAGLDVLWQGRFDLGGASLVLQGSLGVHTAQAVAPYPRTYGRAAASALLDADLVGRLGLLGELNAAYWDTTPIELVGMARVDLVEGLRLKAGALVPVATWAGWTPAGRPAGVRELTLLADLSLIR
jgi:hypothetical protein